MSKPNSATDLDYNEQANQLAREARAADAERLRGILAEMKQAINTESFAMLKTVQLAWEFGAGARRMLGRDNLLPTAFPQFALAVPETQVGFVKECLAVNRLFEEQPTAETARNLVRDCFDKLLVQLELDIKSTHGEQKRHPKEPIEETIAEVVNVSQRLNRLKTEMPMAQWPAFLRDTFIRESKGIHDAHEEAVNMKTRNC